MISTATPITSNKLIPEISFFEHQWRGVDQSIVLFPETTNKNAQWSIIEAYYTSPFHHLELVLNHALSEYNRNRRKSSAPEGEFRPHGKFSNQTVEKISYWFHKSDEYLNQLYDNRLMQLEEKNKLGVFIKQKMTPWLYLSHVPKRVLEKKEGFVGDHHTIEMIYRGSVDAVDHIHPLGRIIDNLFLSLPVCQAVRDRKNALAQFLIHEANNKTSDEPLKVASLGCGKAHELETVFKAIKPSQFSVTLMDVDIRALSGARDILDRIPGASNRVKVKEFNAFGAKNGKLLEELKTPQDIIYSAGLLDYFDDSGFMNYFCMAYGALADNGKLVIGNFSPKNPTKGTMKYLLDWELQFKSEQQMLTLIEKTGLPYQEVSFFYDETHQIQPFLVLKK